MPRVVVTLAGVPSGEGRSVALVGDAATAARLRSGGTLALGPELVEVLGAVGRVFPGSRVVELRKPGGKR